MLPMQDKQDGGNQNLQCLQITEREVISNKYAKNDEAAQIEHLAWIETLNDFVRLNA